MLSITGGQFTGRNLKTPPSNQTRPVTQKNRAAIFNALFAQVLDAKVLDLFAGSGALGLEALSRGAAQVTFIEKSPKVAKIIKQNIEILGLSERAQVLISDAREAARRLEPGQRFGLIFLDPPYAHFEVELAEQAADLLQSGGILVVSLSSKTTLPESVGEARLLKDKTAGDSQFGFYQRLAAGL